MFVRRVIHVVYTDLLKRLNYSTATARVPHSAGSTVALSRQVRRAAVRTQSAAKSARWGWRQRRTLTSLSPNAWCRPAWLARLRA